MHDLRQDAVRTNVPTVTDLEPAHSFCVFSATATSDQGGLVYMVGVA